MDGKLIITQLTYSNQQHHFLVKYVLRADPSGRKRTKARQCKLYHIEGRGQKDTMYYCISCGEKSSFYNDPNRDCFKQHVAKNQWTIRSSLELFDEV
jgi:hypothetical protein